MNLIAIFEVGNVLGMPRPRACINNKTGKPYLYNGDARAKALKLAIVSEYVKTRIVDEPMTGPVGVAVDTFRPLPTTRPKRVESEPDILKPDIDNILKLVLDALKGVAYVDDDQIVDAEVHKNPRRRGQKLRTVVRVYSLGEAS